MRLSCALPEVHWHTLSSNSATGFYPSYCVLSQVAPQQIPHILQVLMILWLDSFEATGPHVNIFSGHCWSLICVWLPSNDHPKSVCNKVIGCLLYNTVSRLSTNSKKTVKAQNPSVMMRGWCTITMITALPYSWYILDFTTMLALQKISLLVIFFLPVASLCKSTVKSVHTVYVTVDLARLATSSKASVN